MVASAMAEEGSETLCGFPLRSTIRFGPYELDLRAAELRKGSTRIRLQTQPFQILVALLERPGEVVLREEIRKRLWPENTVVEFDHSINAAVKRLRDALLDSADKPRYVETMPKRGYRFIGSVEPPLNAIPHPAVSASAEDGTPLISTIGNAETSKLRIASPLAMRSSLLGSVLFGVLICGLYWFHHANAQTRWARQVGIPQAIRLADQGKGPQAFSFILRARQAIPDDPVLSRIRREISHPIAIRTNPPRATIWVKAYEEPNAEWLLIGNSPIENFQLPLGYFRWKVAKPGFRTVEAAAGFQSDTIDFTLDPESRLPPEMVHIPNGDFQLNNLDPVRLDDYWLDEYEVTNRQFKKFLEIGGYRTSQYWNQEFIRDGNLLSRDRAMSLFRDTTGRLGPATWELGDYPAGQDDFPVSGVSWYEAAAYAEYTKKQLPSIYHWYRAAGHNIYSDILFFGNFDSRGPKRVGSTAGLGPYGTYDMAGNVREWCWNGTGTRRYIAGGAWNDQRYKYLDLNAVDPFDRSPANGFRCIKSEGKAPPAALLRPVEQATRDYLREKPVNDGAFKVIRSLYTYDQTDLKASTELRTRGREGLTAEKITFAAAYGQERVIAWLYLPQNVRPPYQTVLYVPPRSAIFLNQIDSYEVKFIEFLVKTGRAVMFPVCQGMYDRRQNTAPGLSGTRDRVIQQYKDLRRSVDYLETRSDIDHDRLGYYGVSDGARLGLILLAQEHRIRTAVLAAGGLSPENKPIEVDEVNFAPRVLIPVLMLNGRYDLFYPAETNQAVLFKLLGSSPKDKRYVLYDSGHVPFQQE
jgi:formylglycine-generating enzyme required for sulfatase activity/DNA-binding winged helix-turn-helix (wHTH) protein